MLICHEPQETNIPMCKMMNKSLDFMKFSLEIKLVSLEQIKVKYFIAWKLFKRQLHGICCFMTFYGCICKPSLTVYSWMSGWEVVYIKNV